MECEFCGESISEGAFACPRCGTPITVSPAGQPGAAGDTPPSGAGEPAGVPLAPVEEDFIAMAEETVLEEDSSRLASEFSTEPQAAEGDDQAAALADQNVPPGAHVTAEEVELDARLTGGYKGPEATSVAGAGEQTADDPFGLKITETAPPISGEETTGGQWDSRRIRNVVVMIVALLAALAVAGFGIYYGLLRKSEPSAGNPEGSVEEFFEIMASADHSRLGDVAVSGTKLISDIERLLVPYEKMGVVGLNKFDGETTSNEAGKATVVVKTLDIEVTSENGSEVFDMLEMTKPFPIPTTILLVEQDGKWFVSN
ncbi:MAG: hypothetical protein L6427_03210 [Actinomycetia bacterium]|nr:hypothetical protein [Actinomycetes bacterium]